MPTVMCNEVTSKVHTSTLYFHYLRKLECTFSSLRHMQTKRRNKRDTQTDVLQELNQLLKIHVESVVQQLEGKLQETRIQCQKHTYSERKPNTDERNPQCLK